MSLPFSGNPNTTKSTAMIPVILALGLATGMALTIAFAFGLLPLVLM